MTYELYLDRDTSAVFLRECKDWQELASMLRLVPNHFIGVVVENEHVTIKYTALLTGYIIGEMV